MRRDYDAIVIGGGPAGSTAAILLADAGWRVAVVEHAKFPRRKVCGEFISSSTWTLLDRLGIASSLIEIAGPPVTHVGLYAGSARLSSRLDPSAATDRLPGRAVGRAHLDTALLDCARQRGAHVWQPWTLSSFEHAGQYRCTITDRESGATEVLSATLLVAAHGSWEPGPLPTQPAHHASPDGPLRGSRQSDLLGFKAHFEAGALPAGLMPLLAFAGGYGGMVHTDGGRISLSCCIRRDALARCRRRWPDRAAGAAVLAHITDSSTGVAAALADALLVDRWIAAGPLRTGIHGFGGDGIFAVGNAAAEAHPVIAEGISMAIQSAALLADALTARAGAGEGAEPSSRSLEQARAQYSRAWRGSFSTRLHAAAAFAHLFMRPLPTHIASGVLRHLPRLLTEGARWSGKASSLPRGCQSTPQRRASAVDSAAGIWAKS